MRYIGQSIGLLRFGQRPPRPVGKAAGLVHSFLGNLSHQRLIADLLTKAAHHSCNLSVKQRRRDHIPVMEKDFQILARSMKDFHSAFIRHQVVKRLKRNTTRQRVHQNGVVICRTRHSKLHKAELGVIRPLSQKLCVNSDIVVGCGLFAIVSQLCGRGNRSHKGACSCVIWLCLYARA